jgi:hypothetical protein
MSEFVAITGIVSIVGIVAISLGYVFRAKVGSKGVEMDTEPAEKKGTDPPAKRRK